MTELPRVLYTKFPKSDLQQKKHTLSDTGLFKKNYFEDPRDIRLKKTLSVIEVIVRVPIEAFADRASFTQVADGIWENCSPVLSKDVFEYEIPVP